MLKNKVVKGLATTLIMVSMISLQCFAASESVRMNPWGFRCKSCSAYLTQVPGSDPCHYCNNEAFTFKCDSCGNYYMICTVNGHYNNIYVR